MAKRKPSMSSPSDPSSPGGSAASTRDAAPEPAAMGFEQALAELETIIERIEQGEVGLEESLAQYRRGAALVRRCRAILDQAEQQVERITAEELARIDGAEDHEDDAAD